MSTAREQFWHIPEIVSDTWTNKLIGVKVPAICTKCGAQRDIMRSVRDPKYGHLSRSYCIKGCKETYEEIRLQAEAYKAGAGAATSTKLKFDPWVPSTRVGTGHTSREGMTCNNKICKEFIPYAEPNQKDGKTFLCRRCRGIL